MYPGEYGFVVNDVYDGAYDILKKGTILDRDYYVNANQFYNRLKELEQAVPTGIIDELGHEIYKFPKGTKLSQDTHLLSTDIVLPK